MKRKQAFPPESMVGIESVQALEPWRLSVRWNDGRTSVIDIGPWVVDQLGAEALEPSGLFASVRLGEDGWAVYWGEDEDHAVAELDHLHLWLLEQEGRGLVLTGNAFRRWRKRHGLSQEAVAKALGISRRMVLYYESGKAFVPTHIGLACKGWSALQDKPSKGKAA
jgi:DNA-binding transcriptional regulator YiaG